MLQDLCINCSFYFFSRYRIFEPGSRYKALRDTRTGLKDVDLNFSNVGRWSFETNFDSVGKISDLWTCQSGGFGTGMLVYSSCVDSHLCLSISHMREIIPDSFANVLLDCLLDFCEGRFFDFAALSTEQGNTDILLPEFVASRSALLRVALPEALKGFYDSRN